MKKLKFLVSSLIAMLAFAIFAVTGIKVHAATTATLNCNLTDETPTLSDSYVTISYNGSIGKGNSNTLTWQGVSTTFTKITRKANATIKQLSIINSTNI